MVRRRQAWTDFSAPVAALGSGPQREGRAPAWPFSFRQAFGLGEARPSLRRVGLALACVWVTAAGAAEPPAPFLPPLTGEVSGDFRSLEFPGAPKLHWKVALRTGTAGQRVADLTVEGPGARLAVKAQLDVAANGTWELAAADIGLPEFVAAFAPTLAPSLAGVTFTGHLVLTGAGVVEHGDWRGRVHFELRDGAVRDDANGWAVGGLTLRGDLGQLPGLASDGPVFLAFREAKGAGVAARDGEIEFQFDAAQSVSVRRATCVLLDGRVALAPFTVNPAQPEIRTTVEFTDLELTRIANLLPPVLTDAQGRVSGRMAMTWTPAGGWQPGQGRLQIKSGEWASLKLSPQAGFLTSHVPKQLALLPSWLGPLARAFSPVNPAYETLRAIEMGETRLEVHTLEVGLQPEGDPNGRTARVVVIGRPATGEVVESVRFEINVVGPLADVVRMGWEGRINAHTR